jgi:hypothetical protein
MERCWTLDPTSDRIIADISGLVEVLQKIIEHNGCVIPECRLRHGRRQMTHNGGRVCKRKVKARQRKGFKPQVVHPDALEAIQILLGILPLQEPESAEVDLPEAMELEIILNEVPESDNSSNSSDSHSDNEFDEEI